MDLNEIAVFAQVVKAGSFTSAARELKMPKSTVSRKVSELEERLGARLLQRSTRTLHLTEAGRALYPYATRIVSEAALAESAVAELSTAPRGLLRVTTPLSFGYLGAVVAHFLTKCPDVEIEMVATDRVVDLIEEGFDLGIRAGVLSDSALIARRLGTLRAYVVASAEYLGKHAPPKSPADLAGHMCLGFGAAPEPRKWILQDGPQKEIVSIDPKLLVNDYDILRGAVGAGLGIALLPSLHCAADLKSNRLTRVLPDWHSPSVPLQAVYPSGRHLSPAVTALVTHLHESHSELDEVPPV